MAGSALLVAAAVAAATLIAAGTELAESAQAPAARAAAVETSPRPTAAAPVDVGYGWPLSPDPRVIRPYAPGPQVWSPGHRGVDLAASVGSPLLAAGAGVVSFAGPVAGRAVVV